MPYPYKSDAERERAIRDFYQDRPHGDVMFLLGLIDKLREELKGVYGEACQCVIDDPGVRCPVHDKAERVCESFAPALTESGPDADCVYCHQPQWAHGIAKAGDK